MHHRTSLDSSAVMNTTAAGHTKSMEEVTLDLVGNDFSAVVNDFGIPDGRECIPDGRE